MQVPFVGLQIEQHQHEQVQDQDRTRIDDDLDHGQEFRVQEDEQAGHVQQESQKRNSAVHRIFQGNREERGHNANQRAVSEEGKDHRGYSSGQVFGWQRLCWFENRLGEEVAVVVEHLIVFLLIVRVQVFLGILDESFADLVEPFLIEQEHT